MGPELTIAFVAKPPKKGDTLDPARFLSDSEGAQDAVPASHECRGQDGCPGKPDADDDAAGDKTDLGSLLRSAKAGDFATDLSDEQKAGIIQELEARVGGAPCP